MAGMIDQHNSVEPEAIPDDQTSEEIKAVKFVQKIFKKAKKRRSVWDKNWVGDYHFFRGKQWAEKRPPYRHSEVLNFTHAAIQTIIPILTDNRPNIEAIPEDPSDFEFAEVISQILVSKWDRHNWAEVVAAALIDASITGTAIGHVPWDPEAARGIGDYDFATIEPLYFYPDPNAEDVNDKKGKYFIVAEPLDVDEVKRRHPKKKDLIKADVSDLEDSKLAKADFSDVIVRSAIDGRTLVEGDKAVDPEASDKVLYITAWVDSDEMIEERLSEEDEQGNVKEVFQTRKKFPNGRKIVVAGNVLLEDGPNPYMDGGAPFAKLVDHILPREFWGDGEISQLQSPQVMINKLISYVLDTLMIMGNPIWLVPNNSGIDTENLVNSPGLIVEHNPEGAPRRQEGAQLQPFVLQTLDRIQSIFEKVSGISEVSQGVAPGAGSSGIQVELLQEAAQTKLRLKGRNLEAFLAKIGDLMVSRILQFYTVPRVFRITNDQEGSQFFKFSVEERIDAMGEAQQVATITPFEKTDQGFQEQPSREMPIKGRLDVKISTGTSLPFAKAQKATKARELLELGIMDEEDFLAAIDWPGAEKLVAKFKERQEQAEQIAAEQAAQGIQPEQAPQG